MSWTSMVKKALNPFEVTFSEGKGSLIVKPIPHPNMTLMILVRKMQFSFEMKFEMVNVVDIAEDRLRKQDPSQLLKRMLAESVELEAKGFMKKKIEIRRWGELNHLSKVLDIPEGGALIQFFKKIGSNLNSSFELIEIFPKLIPDEIMEYYFMSSGKYLSTLKMIRDYLESPNKISWIVRLHLLYGVPGVGRIRDGYLSAINMGEKIEEFAYTSLFSLT